MILAAASMIFFASCSENRCQVKETLDVTKNGTVEYKAASTNEIATFPGEEKMNYATDIITGAQSVDEYLPLLQGKRVCILSNRQVWLPPQPIFLIPL